MVLAQQSAKGWFPYDRRRSQTIADRKSQIADERKDSCFHVTADDRERSQSRLLPTFRSAECKNYRRFTLAGKSHQNNMADVEEEILLQANLFLLLVLKRSHRQLQNRRKYRFWVRKIFLKRRELGAFHTLVRELRVSDFSPAIGLFVSVFEFLTVTVVNALISRNFLHKFLVTNATLFNASHVYDK